MSSLSNLSYGESAARHQHPVAKRFFEIAEAKKSNLIVSADFSTTEELLKSADGFIAMKFLADVDAEVPPTSKEDFIIFTTGINQSQKGDKLGQQYKAPSQAVQGSADFIVAGRDVYAAEDPIKSAKSYQKEGWEAYLTRIGGQSSM